MWVKKFPPFIEMAWIWVIYDTSLRCSASETAATRLSTPDQNVINHLLQGHLLPFFPGQIEGISA
jgi:hypothetical protein